MPGSATAHHPPFGQAGGAHVAAALLQLAQGRGQERVRFERVTIRDALDRFDPLVLSKVGAERRTQGKGTLPPGFGGIDVRNGVRADERPATILRARKHGVAGHCFFRRHFFLQDVPMFNDKIALESKNVRGNKGLAPAA